MMWSILTHLAASSFGACIGVILFAILQMARHD